MTPVLLLLLLPTTPRDEMTATLQVPSGGATVKFDLSSLRKQDDAFRITWSGGGEVVRGEGPGTYSIRNIRVGEGLNEIVIVHSNPKLRIVLKVISGATRNCDARWVTLGGKRFASLSGFDSGKGEWKTSAGEDLEVTTAGGLAVNTVRLDQLGELSPIAACGGGALYILSNEQLQPWIGVGQKYFRSIIKDDRKTFVSCYNAKDRRGASHHQSRCSYHWRAGREKYDLDGVRKYLFQSLRKSSNEKRKVLQFLKYNAKGQRVGRVPASVCLELEEGRWVVTSATW